jgi:signal transduction histidine kinase/predicted negative regulator of RcsB-dependent stress response
MENFARLKYFVIVAFTLLTTTVFAQPKNIDSLETALQRSLDDSLKIELLVQLSVEYESEDFSKSLKYAEDAVVIADRLKEPWAINLAYRNMGITQILLGDYSTALRFSTQYLQNSIGMNDSLEMAIAYNMIGDHYFDLGEYDEAYFYFTQSYRIANAKPDSIRMAVALHNVGRVFKVLGQYERANSHLELSRKMSAMAGDKLGEPYSLDELGDVLFRQGKYDSALIFFNESLNSMHTLEDPILKPRTLSRIANVYMRKGDFNLAFNYYDSALLSYTKTKNKLGTADVELGRGQIYAQQGKFEEAKTAFEKSLVIAQELNARTLEIRCYNNLSSLWEKKGDYKKSLEYFKSFKLLEDSLFSLEMNEKLFRDQMRFETESKDTRIAQLSRLEEVQKSEIKRQEFILNIFVIVGALAGVLLVTIYRSGQRRRKINKLLLEHQQETEKRSEELEKLNQVKDKFFSIISHDLRSPINALAGLLDLMDRGALAPQDMSKNIQELKARFNHTRTLLNNLLDWTLLQMDKLSLQPAKIDMSKIAAENIQMLRSVQEKNITFSNDIEEGTFAFADSNTINLVIRNLVTNAIKFTNEGGHIQLFSVDKGKFWSISVKDDGVGMKPEVLKMLFDKTSPYSTRGTANEKGTGLGLILCKEFVEKNGGEISVVSAEGSGSTFSFTVPKA